MTGFYWFLNVSLLLHPVPDPGIFNILVKGLRLTSEGMSIFRHKKEPQHTEIFLGSRTKKQRHGLKEM